MAKAAKRALQGPLRGAIANTTTVRVIERQEIDRRYLRMLVLGDTPFQRTETEELPPGRVFLETESAKPAWIIRWRTLPPSHDELMREYDNDHAYLGLVRSWHDVFWAAMLEAKIPKAGGRRRLEITRFIREEKFRLDRGNLVGGCKPLLDAAVRAGLLIDDREEHLDDHYRQAIDSDERVEILVYNV